MIYEAFKKLIFGEYRAQNIGNSKDYLLKKMKVKLNMRNFALLKEVFQLWVTEVL